MSKHITRRKMLRNSVAAGAGLWLGGRYFHAGAASPNDKLNIAVVGIGGQGRANLNNVANLKQNIVALCDVDDKKAGDAYKRFPWAKKSR